MPLVTTYLVANTAINLTNRHKLKRERVTNVLNPAVFQTSEEKERERERERVRKRVTNVLNPAVFQTSEEKER